MLELYRRIRQRREELGMSQKELAKKLGYKSRSSVNKIEKGENDIPQSKIAAFAEALDTTPEYLMGWYSPKPSCPPNNDENIEISNEHIEVLNDYDSLNEESKGLIRGMMRQLKVNNTSDKTNPAGAVQKNSISKKNY